MDSLRLFGGVALLSTWIELETHYFYALMGVLVATAFLVFPTRKSDPPARPHDVVLAVLALLLCGISLCSPKPFLTRVGNSAHRPSPSG